MYLETNIVTNKLTDEIAENNTKKQDDSLKISVIIPAFMEEKLLAKTLSIFTPELKSIYNIEVIVSDGGSTDTTVAIAQEYADIVVVHSLPERQTISQGRNRGAEKASGDILMFLNGDCTLVEPVNFFNYIKDWYLRNNEIPGCDAIACKVGVSPDEILFKDKVFYFLHNNYVRFLNFIGFGMGRGECQIVKKAIFNKISGYDETIAAGEDFDLYRRISKIGKIKYTSKLVVHESPRRFRKFGYIRILWSWTLNSMSVMFRGKSVSNEWEAVR
jgi:glycosyltransferase involved in cell wall biosynthesis